MNCIQTLIETIALIERAQTPKEIFGTFKFGTKEIGVDRLLVTGIPLPGQKLNGLLLHNDWPHIKTGKITTPEATDLIIQKSIDWPAAFILREQFYHTSSMAIAAGLPRKDMEILIIPVITDFFHQGVVVTTFKRDGAHKDCIAEESMSLTQRAAMTSLVSAMFYTLKKIEALPLKRDGDLTQREKEVLSLSALGHKAAKTGKILKISERTVVAHLQNASVKLGANNRTECVLQAIRYNQIGPGAGLGFYQIETEIFPDNGEI